MNTICQIIIIFLSLVYPLFSQTTSYKVDGIGKTKELALEQALKKYAHIITDTLYKKNGFKVAGLRETLLSEMQAIEEFFKSYPIDNYDIKETITSKGIEITLTFSLATLDIDLKKNIDKTIATAETYITKDEFSKSLLYYYTAYIKSILSNDPNGKETIKNKILAILSPPQFKINVGNSVLEKGNATNITIQVPIFVTYNEKEAMNNLWGKLQAIGSAYGIVQNGKTIAFIYGNRPNKKAKYSFTFGPVLNSLTPGSLLSGLHSITPRYMLSDTTEIEIDFGNIVTIDFKPTHTKDTTYFTSNIKNVSISEFKSVTWFFGDGDSAIGINAKHFYKQRGVYPVTMKVNGVDEFVRVKDIEIRSENRVEIVRDSIEFVSQAIVAKEMLVEKENRIITMLISKLTQSPNDFLLTLEDYLYKGDLLYGREGDFPRLDLCYVFIVTKEDRRLKAALTKGKNERINLLTNEKIRNTAEYLKRNENEYKVWIEIK